MSVEGALVVVGSVGDSSPGIPISPACVETAMITNNARVIAALFVLFIKGSGFGMVGVRTVVLIIG
jgi:hypothetical protein